MEPDYSGLDPDERYHRYMALASVSLGIISLCAALIPICGIICSLAGIGLGILGRRSESRKMAIIGIGLSILGFMIAVTYQFLVYFKKF
jgi:hypothetical protein